MIAVANFNKDNYGHAPTVIIDYDGVNGGQEAVMVNVCCVHSPGGSNWSAS